MLPQGEELHQTVGSEAAIQIEGRPGEAAAARDGEEDADALRNPSGVEDDKEQEDAQQPGDKENQIVRGQPLELEGRSTPLWMVYCAMSEEEGA